MFTDNDGTVFNDRTATNFGAVTDETESWKLTLDPGSVYAWSVDDFDVNYDSWTAGTTINLDSAAEPEIISFKATTSPYLGSNVEMTANGTVTGAGGSSATFDDTNVYTENYWQVTDGNGTDYWVAKLTDGTNSMIVSSYDFANGTSLTLTGLDTSPGSKTADTTDFESRWDASSGGTAEVPTNSSVYPRIDQATSPISPAHLSQDGRSEDWSVILEKEFTVYQRDAILLNSDGTLTINSDPSLRGTFFSQDNDDFISDGSADYGANSVNDNDQVGRAVFPDGTTIPLQTYQAEAGRGITFTNAAGEEVTSTIVLISFGTTYSTDAVWFVQNTFDFNGTNYQRAGVDGTPGYYNGGSFETAIQYTALLVCFVRGTLIKTMDGYKAVEEIKAGDYVLTKDNDYQPVRWMGSSVIDNARLQADKTLLPVRIAAGALGFNTPSEDLFVSRQHRVLVGSKIVKEMFDQDEVLIKAKDLVGIVPGVTFVDMSGDLEGEVEYFHILFDEHQIVHSNGALTESFYLGDTSLQSLDDEARAEIQKIFPEVLEPKFSYTLARTVPLGSPARECLARHFDDRRQPRDISKYA